MCVYMTEETPLLIARAARSVRSAAPALPAHEEMERELIDAEAAQQRGYFLPDEDERIREVFVRYLSARAVLLETVDAVIPVLDGLEEEEGEDAWRLRMRAFVIGFSAASMEVGSLYRRGARAAIEAGRDRQLSDRRPGLEGPSTGFRESGLGVKDDRPWKGLFHEETAPLGTETGKGM